MLHADVSSNAASRGQKRAFLWLTVSLGCEFTRLAYTTQHTLLSVINKLSDALNAKQDAQGDTLAC